MSQCLACYSAYHRQYREAKKLPKDQQPVRREYKHSVKKNQDRRWGKLRAYEYLGGSKWRCVCECGNTIDLRDSKIPLVTHCGCVPKPPRKIRPKGRQFKYKRVVNGQRTPTYYSWCSMKSRCLREADPDYHIYGGRGITICDRWVNSFDNFVDDMGFRPEGTTIDRINPDGNYEPGNCRWATPKQQTDNRIMRKRTGKRNLQNGTESLPEAA